MDKNTILLVGTGPMGTEYAKILLDMGKKIIAVGKDGKSLLDFKKETGIEAIGGGITKWLKNNENHPDKAIVAVTENMLGTVALELIKAGIKSLLIEKPGGFNFNEIRTVDREAKKYQTKVCIGYNRRAYASVEKAKEIIKKDGGVTSFNFEFTEWGHIIAPLKKAKGVKEQWFLHNSTHVIDLAFFLGGEPKKISSYTAGGLSWHPKASVFAGAGVTEKGAIFSYQANWEAPGRWSVEILTKKHRLIFRPLEKLQIQNIGSVATSEVKINDKYDLKFKPGLYKQILSFLNNDFKELCSIKEQVRNLKFYKIIGGTRSDL